ncbi:DUF3027 domain-containing protein [Gordonia sp. (in: high G+C Gram-positive bacteria)]|uniref:DUF3027 domain-containing protein n=1 Tax=Gordonia sp. (in: high G+C Gram-positive bacteria) TaxID=84139 RepID=UPI0025B82E9A|nr:DUF3027 domain-containing protein [Gordonia sp. (in: high G+C Gram-positive bacteria)]
MSLAIDNGTAVNSALVDAVAFARDALIADGEQPGEHLGATAEGEFAATHYFAAQVPGYRGWQWCVVVAGAPDSTELTVSEAVLLPGDGALLAPEWVPWVDRIAAGDLGPGDTLAAPDDDPRLVPGQIDTLDVDPIDRDQVGQVAAEIGLGRKRLLSFDGRAEAAQRWHDGEYGPASEMARSARHSCGTCGFYLPIAGALHGAFGVCANEMAADGRAVSVDYGCGAHSDVRAATGAGSPAYDAYDDGAVEIVTLPKPAAAPEVASSEAETSESSDPNAPSES